MCALIAGVVLSASAQNLYLNDVKRLPHGASNAVALWKPASTTYGVIGQGMDLVVFDLTTPTAPVEVGRATLVGMPKRIVIQNSIAYVAIDTMGVQTVDLTTPAAPVARGYVDGYAGTAKAIALSGGKAYVALGGPTMEVLDVSTPATPVYDTICNVRGNSSDVAIWGKFAIVTTSGSGISAVDTTNPISLKKFMYLPGFGFGLEVSGNNAFIALSDSGLGVYSLNGLNNTPPTIDRVARASIGSSSRRAVDVALAGTKAYVAVELGGVVSVDIANPALPVPLDTLITTAGTGQVAALDNLVLVSEGEYGVQVINTTNPSAMVLAATIKSPGAVLDVAIRNNFAWTAASTNGVQGVDISVPANAVVKKYFPSTFSRTAMGVAWRDSMIGCAIDNYGLDMANLGASNDSIKSVKENRFGVLSTAICANTVGWAIAERDSGVRNVGLSFSLAGLKQWNVANGGLYNTRGSALAVASLPSDSTVVVADGDSGVTLVTMSRTGTVANRPTFVSSLQTPGKASGVAVASSHAYIAAGDSGLVIVNVATKTAPTIAGKIALTGTCTGVAVSGDTVYVGATVGTTGRIYVVNVASKSAPVLICTKNTDFPVRRLAVSGGNVYSAEGEGGLAIYNASTTPVVIRKLTPSSRGILISASVSGGFVTYSLSGQTRVVVDLHTSAGRKVAGLSDNVQTSGTHKVALPQLSTGQYWVRIGIGAGNVAARSLVVVR